jgi:hypothetical protein
MKAGHKGEGHRVCKVGADDADGRQPRIEKEEHGHDIFLSYLDVVL